MIAGNVAPIFEAALGLSAPRDERTEVAIKSMTVLVNMLTSPPSKEGHNNDADRDQKQELPLFRRSDASFDLPRLTSSKSFLELA